MNCKDFAVLPEGDKSRILYKHGSYIGKRKNGSIAIVLYQLNDFYVEVLYYKYRVSIYKIKCTERMEVLDGYLDQVNIEDAVESLVKLNS
jgi:hypothetical protein